MVYAPGCEVEKEKAAFPEMVSGFAGWGDNTETASGEKKATAALPSDVANETVSPLTTGTDGAFGTKAPFV